MARKKKAQAEPEQATVEHVVVTVDDETANKFVEWVDDVSEAIAEHADAINEHAKAGNQLAERLSRVELLVSAHGVLLTALRDDIKRARTQNTFHIESLQSSLESIEDSLGSTLELARIRLTQLEDVVFADEEPSVWTRIRWWFRDRFGGRQ